MDELTPAELAAIEARVQAATAGPWRWRGHASGHQSTFSLRSLAKGKQTVMTFRRWGWQGAQPVFQVDGILRPAIDFMIQPEPHNPYLVTGIDHPDAVFIEHARDDVERLCAEVRWLQHELLAITSERDDYLEQLREVR